MNLLKLVGNWLWARAQERSTWLGVIALATAGGINIAPELAGAIVNTGVAVVSTIAIATKG